MSLLYWSLLSLLILLGLIGLLRINGKAPEDFEAKDWYITLAASILWPAGLMFLLIVTVIYFWTLLIKERQT